MMTRHKVVLALALWGFVTQAPGAGISDDAVRIGFLTDLSGPTARADGSAGADAIRMAIADMGGEINGKKIELLIADHQGKPAVAQARATQWFDENHLDMLLGGTNSAAALSMAAVAAEKKRPFFAVGAGTSLLTNEKCTRYTIHYAYSTATLVRSTASNIVRDGGKHWTLLTTDSSLGQALAQEAAKAVRASGGDVVDEIRIPPGTTDPAVLARQVRNAAGDVLGLASTGADLVALGRATSPALLARPLRRAGLLTFIDDVHTLGLDDGQGIFLTAPWYWNLNDATRTWSKRFFEQQKRAPSFLQAADYSATKAYLEAVKATGTDDGDSIMDYLKSHKINDMFVKDGTVRKDGLMVHDLYLLQVKTPAESKEPWDDYKVVRSVPAQAAYGPPTDSTCALLSH